MILIFFFLDFIDIISSINGFFFFGGIIEKYFLYFSGIINGKVKYFECGIWFWNIYSGNF